MRYYYCASCGYVEDFGFDRQRGVKCKNCGNTDLLAELDRDDYLETVEARKAFIQELDAKAGRRSDA